MIRRFAALLVALFIAAESSVAQTRIQVGYCTSLKNIAAAQAAGFDYIEVGTSEIAAMSDTEFQQALNEARRVGLPVPAANLFLPATLKVVGDAADPARQQTYVRNAFDRLKQLGVQLVVFGSGGARRVPDGFSTDDAFAQLVAFGRLVAPEARARGITVAIEPLRIEETNIVNSAAEGLTLVEAIGDPNFRLMIDFYHLASAHESSSIVERAASRLRHLHVANPNGRVFPRDWAEFDYAPFFAALRHIHYVGRISVEASTKDLSADAPPAIALLRHAFE